MGLENKLKPSHRCCIPFLSRYFEHSFNVANKNCASKPWEAMSGRAKSVVASKVLGAALGTQTFFASLLKPGNLLYVPAIATRSSTDHHRWSNLHRKRGACNPQTPAEVAPITHICGSGNSSDNSIVSRILHIAVSFSNNTLTDRSLILLWVRGLLGYSALRSGHSWVPEERTFRHQCQSRAAAIMVSQAFTKGRRDATVITKA